MLYNKFLRLSKLLTYKSIKQDYQPSRLSSSFRKFYAWCNGFFFSKYNLRSNADWRFPCLLFSQPTGWLIKLGWNFNWNSEKKLDGPCSRNSKFWNWSISNKSNFASDCPWVLSAATVHFYAHIICLMLMLMHIFIKSLKS